MYCPGITPMAPLRGPGCVGVKASRHAQNTRRTLSAPALAADMITTWGEDDCRSDAQVPFPTGGRVPRTLALRVWDRATLRCGARASPPGSGGASAQFPLGGHSETSDHIITVRTFEAEPLAPRLSTTVTVIV